MPRSAYLSTNPNPVYTAVSSRELKGSLEALSGLANPGRFQKMNGLKRSCVGSADLRVASYWAD